MSARRFLAFSVALAACSFTLHAASLPVLHNHCEIGPQKDGAIDGRFSLRIGDQDCMAGHGCNMNLSTARFDRFTGIAASDLEREGAQVTATLREEAGTFTCVGTVHSGELRGESTFTPDQGFVDRMSALGLSGFNSEKLQVYALIGVHEDWARGMFGLGIGGVTVDKLLALRIFNATPEYVHSLTELGYPTPTADQLIGICVQKVDPQQIRELRTMGFNPTFEELTQIGVFHITPEFARRMQERGLKNLTIAKLVEIKIFKLAE